MDNQDIFIGRSDLANFVSQDLLQDEDFDLLDNEQNFSMVLVDYRDEVYYFL